MPQITCVTFLSKFEGVNYILLVVSGNCMRIDVYLIESLICKYNIKEFQRNFPPEKCSAYLFDLNSIDIR